MGLLNAEEPEECPYRCLVFRAAARCVRGLVELGLSHLCDSPPPDGSQVDPLRGQFDQTDGYGFALFVRS